MLRDSKKENKEEVQWDVIIESGKGRVWSDSKEIWRYRELIRMFVKRDLKTMYAQTFLGPVWLIVTALLSSSVMMFIFGGVANISTDGIPQFLFYMSGNILWINFSGCVSHVSSTFLSYSSLMGKVYFPRMCVPIATVLSRQFHFLIQFLIFFGVYSYFFVIGTLEEISWMLVLTPVLILQMILLSLGCGIILSSLTVKYRDFSVLVTFGLQLWMYATPIVYPTSQIPENLRWIYMLNPVTPIIETFRYIWFKKGIFNLEYWGISGIMSIFIFVIGLMIFQRVQRKFVDMV